MKGERRERATEVIGKITEGKVLQRSLPTNTLAKHVEQEANRQNYPS